jgi:tetratricopeptide (TPR) repeat protein
LTGRLADLKRYNGLWIPSAYFQEALERLRKDFLSISLDAVLHSLSAEEKEDAEAQQHAAFSAPPVERSVLTAQEYFERALWAKDNTERMRLYDAAIGLKPDFAAALNNRGLCRHIAGDLRGARADFDVAVRIGPDATVYRNRGNLRREQDDTEGAFRDYSEAVALGDLAALHNRAIFRHVSLGDVEGAFADYDAVIDHDPEKADAYVDRARLRKQLDDVDGASSDLDKAIELAPTSTAFDEPSDSADGERRCPPGTRGSGSSARTRARLCDRTNPSREPSRRDWRRARRARRQRRGHPSRSRRSGAERQSWQVARGATQTSTAPKRIMASR